MGNVHEIYGYFHARATEIWSFLVCAPQSTDVPVLFFKSGLQRYIDCGFQFHVSVSFSKLLSCLVKKLTIVQIAFQHMAAVFPTIFVSAGQEWESVNKDIRHTNL